MKLRYLIAFAVGFVSVGFSQVIFTVNATAIFSGLGYDSGQAYNFVFTTTGNSLSGNSGNLFTSTDTLWMEDFTSESQLYSGISGSGVTGTYVSPSSSAGAPTNAVGIYKDGPITRFYILVNDENSTKNIGSQTPSSVNIQKILFDVATLGPAFSYPGTYTDLTTYMTTYVGFYNSPGSTTGGSGVTDTFDVFQQFSVNSITIASAIPEPATYAAILGVVGLGVVIWRRRGVRSVVLSGQN